MNIVDLSSLPVPTIVETLDFETIVAAQLADFQARVIAAGGTFTALVESDPAYLIIESAAYRELLLRQRVNSAAKGVMLAYAVGPDLDQIAANYNLTRLTITPANITVVPPTAAVMESDASFLRRILLTFEGLTTAGPANSYIFNALNASADVRDASAISPSSGQVLVSILSNSANNPAPSATLAAVTAALNSDTVRPLCDTVTVQSAAIVNYSITATLILFSGPDSSVIMANALASAQAYATAQFMMGMSITLSGIYTALHVSGVQDVQLTSPGASITNTKTQAPFCTSINLTYGGTVG